ncbi:MAG: hypothetical protein IT460_08390 [Planctomycetes bacterium]|nr:hypothetical protein [Planctomycetota bacterium]
MDRVVQSRRVASVLVVALVVAAFAASRAGAEPAPDGRFRRIHVIDFRGEIEPALAAYLVRQVGAAERAGADAVVLRIDSPGGRVDSSKEIADAVLGLPKTVRSFAFVEHEAISGATLVALACDEIVLGPHATIGDCQPILMTGGGFVPAGEKIETVLRAWFRRFAEDNGWDPVLCEKFVSKDKEVVLLRTRTEPVRELYADGDEFASARDGDLVQGVAKKDLERVRVAVAKDRLLTLTATEAKAYGFVRRIVADERAFLATVSAEGAVVETVEMSWKERTSRWLLGIAGVLGAIVVLCAGITVFQGIGFATIVGACALVLVGLVTVTADLTDGFPLLLIGVGIVLLAAEAFLLPGFGVAGILGIVSTGAGFLFLSTGFSPGGSGGHDLSWATAASFLAQFAATLLVGGAILLSLSRLFPSLPFFRHRLHLPDGGLAAGATQVAGTPTPAAGDAGVAATPLRPAGRATIDGRSVDVTSDGGFVDAGTPLRVVRVEGARVVVRATGPAPGAAS